MLVVALVVAAILLVVANLYSFRPGCGVVGLCVLGAGLFWLVMIGAILLLPVGIQFLLLVGVMASGRGKARRPADFLKRSLAATAVAFGIATCISLATDERENARLRRQFPYESIAARLPAPRVAGTGAPLGEVNEEEMTLLEKAVQSKDEHYVFNRRDFLLRRLHENQVGLFMDSRGFGVARLLNQPSEERITRRLRPDTIVPQPAAAAPAGAAGEPAPAGESEGLRLLHRDGVADFVYPAGFGYVKDRRHVAGFQSHRFSEVPGPEEAWRVQRLELVSLLLHDPPAVYVSESLPRMDKLRGAATRPLDRFEAAALNRLHGGEYLLMADVPGGARMLGAIRSVKQCTGCHGGQRGDLLGAFSYTLSGGIR